jgi:hypothetical protein
VDKEGYLMPAEKNREVLKLYRSSLRSGKLQPDSFLFTIASHHTKSSKSGK